MLPNCFAKGLTVTEARLCPNYALCSETGLPSAAPHRTPLRAFSFLDTVLMALSSLQLEDSTVLSQGDDGFKPPRLLDNR